MKNVREQSNFKIQEELLDKMWKKLTNGMSDKFVMQIYEQLWGQVNDKIRDQIHSQILPLSKTTKM